jgi:hypothetical protein
MAVESLDLERVNPYDVERSEPALYRRGNCRITRPIRGRTTRTVHAQDGASTVPIGGQQANLSRGRSHLPRGPRSVSRLRYGLDEVPTHGNPHVSEDGSLAPRLRHAAISEEGSIAISRRLSPQVCGQCRQTAPWPWQVGQERCGRGREEQVAQRR